MAGIVGGASMGPGSPQPVAYNYRKPSLGKPAISYEPGSGHVDTTVGQGKGGSKLAASFQPRPPPHPPGSGGIGEHVDVQA
jgi:hypothetical protein